MSLSGSTLVPCQIEPFIAGTMMRTRVHGKDLSLHETDRVIAGPAIDTDLASYHVPSKIMEPGREKERMDYYMVS